ncbi:TPA: hypothetical protein OXJ23_001018 [Staphylococcus aureus]|nr:hypothetical protein [Staphylococcus aureus]HCW3604959.1 hypothetical protein [Staphylococcus aureus]
MIEQWRPIKNYKGIYEISNLGNVKSLARTIIKKTEVNRIKRKLKKSF